MRSNPGSEESEKRRQQRDKVAAGVFFFSGVGSAVLLFGEQYNLDGILMAAAILLVLVIAVGMTAFSLRCSE